MKESNIHVDNVANNLLNRVLLNNIQEQFMKELNILADNVTENLLVSAILQDTEEHTVNESRVYYRLYHGSSRCTGNSRFPDVIYTVIYTTVIGAYYRPSVICTSQR